MSFGFTLMARELSELTLATVTASGRFRSKVGSGSGKSANPLEEEDMRAIVFVAGVLMATPSARAEQLVFYTANFPDATSVQLSVKSEAVSGTGDHDFEVAIGLTETDADGAIKYVDQGSHHARIRCAAPAYVSFGTHKFPIGSGRETTSDDWKVDLWKAFCAVPSS